jgi:hypothetical protein
MVRNRASGKHLWRGGKPTTAQEGWQYGENTLARRPELRWQESGDCIITRSGWLWSYEGRDSPNDLNCAAGMPYCFILTCRVL